MFLLMKFQNKILLQFYRSEFYNNLSAECNDMIVKLPRPELMKLDKILFKVLRFAVTFDNTQISTVKLGWYFSEDEKF